MIDHPVLNLAQYKARRQQRRLEVDLQMRIREVRLHAMNLMTATGELQELIFQLLGKPTVKVRRPISDAVILGIYLGILVAVVLGFMYAQAQGLVPRHG